VDLKGNFSFRLNEKIFGDLQLSFSNERIIEQHQEKPDDR